MRVHTLGLARGRVLVRILRPLLHASLARLIGRILAGKASRREQHLHLGSLQLEVLRCHGVRRQRQLFVDESGAEAARRHNHLVTQSSLARRIMSFVHLQRCKRQRLVCVSS